MSALDHSFFADYCPSCGVYIEIRTEAQNGDFHALCTDLHKQQDWPRGSGLKIPVLAWKRLLVATWERAHGRPAEFYPALDGKGFDVVYKRTSRMAKTEMQELLHFSNAWAAENGVVRTKSKRQQREEAEEKALMDEWSGTPQERVA